MKILLVVLVLSLIAPSVSGQARKRGGAGRDSVRAAAAAPSGHARSSISAEKLREIPIDNLSEAIRDKAGIVAGGAELHFRCSCVRGVVQFDARRDSVVDPWLRLSPPGPQDGARNRGTRSDALIPRRLELVVHSGPRESTLAFDIGLPGPGALLELFDVMGRRVARCDLRSLGAGRHVVRLEASSMLAGVYWARVSRGNTFETARLIRMP